MGELILALRSTPLREVTLIELVGAIVAAFALQNLLFQIGLTLLCLAAAFLARSSAVKSLQR
jgi:hypothetical protein